MFVYAFAMCYAHVLRDGRGHTHTYVTTFTQLVQNCYAVWLHCMAMRVGIESSCTMWLFKKTVVDIKVTRVGSVYCEGDAGFFSA